MSEEQKQERSCNGKKVLIFLTVLSLMFSIASLTLSILSFTNGGGSNSEGKKIVISKKYDKGQTFEKAQATNKPMIVFFYTDWCGYCQKFAPAFHKISKMSEIKKNFAIAYVNCEDTANQKIVEEFAIQGFPTVYVIDADGKRSQLDNNLLFKDDTKDLVSEKALELIGAGD